MHLLLIITGLLSICVHFKTEADARAYIEDSLFQINMHRPTYLGGPLITPNLTWSDKTAAIVQSTLKNCNEWKGGPNHLIHLIKGDENLSKYSWHLEKKSKAIAIAAGSDAERLTILQNFLSHPAHSMQFLNPAQTTIGCADNPCTGQVSSEDAQKAEMTGNTYSAEIVCALEPAGEWPKELLPTYLERLKWTGEGGNSGGNAAEVGTKTGNEAGQNLETPAPQADALKSSQAVSSASALLLISLAINIF